MESSHTDENKNQQQSETQKLKDEKSAKTYVQLFVELSSASSPLSSAPLDPTSANRIIKALDFMAVISSVLLLSDSINIETKVNAQPIKSNVNNNIYAFNRYHYQVDQLFDWIILGPKEGLDEENMTFEEFYLAMASFEKVFKHSIVLVIPYVN